jgi:hypothetical protein
MTGIAQPVKRGGGCYMMAGICMTDDDHTRKLEELERILNDPDVSLDPARVWSLLAEVSQRDCSQTSAPSTAEPPKGLAARLTPAS